MHDHNFGVLLVAVEFNLGIPMALRLDFEHSGIHVPSNNSNTANIGNFGRNLPFAHSWNCGRSIFSWPNQIFLDRVVWKIEK